MQENQKRLRVPAPRVAVTAQVLTAVSNALKVTPKTPRPLKELFAALRTSPAVQALNPSDEALRAALEDLGATHPDIASFISQGRHAAGASA